MHPIHRLLSHTLLAVAAAMPLGAAATNSMNLIYDGIATPNTRAAPTNVAAFNAWCATGAACMPTVQQPMYDMPTGQLKGTIYVWATVPFNSGTVIGSAFCFSEFFVVALAQGDLHANSGPNGTCGATMDPVMKPPKFTHLGVQVMIAGGATVSLPVARASTKTGPAHSPTVSSWVSVGRPAAASASFISTS